MTEMTVLEAAEVKRILTDREVVSAAVREAYLAFEDPTTSNPTSHFLRFADQPRSRIIALPARMRAKQRDIAGIKWVSSFPENYEIGLPRASAVFVLNEMATGRPVALLEATHINIARTAASAALVLAELIGPRSPIRSAGLVGAGPVGQEVVSYIASSGHPIDNLVVNDLREPSAERCVRALSQHATACRTGTLQEALACEIVITATTASTPYIEQPPRAGQIYLNVSLRDFSPAALRNSANIVDDVVHCLREGTSPHLTAIELGHADFITTTIPRLLAGQRVHLDRGVVVSPFGLGILDLAVAWAVLERCEKPKTVVPDFFGDSTGTTDWA